MKIKLLAFLLMLAILAFAAAPENHAQAKGEAWSALVDSGQYNQSWTAASSFFRSHVEKQKWAQMVGAARGPFGAKVSRKVKAVTFAKTLPGAPDGNYAVITFDASFTNKASAIETLTMMDDAGEWRAAGYFVR